MNYFDFFLKKKILITGGLGFIGGNLIINLLETTNCTILNLDKNGYASDSIKIDNYINKNSLKKSNYKFLKLDLRNKKEVKEAINFFNPDLIFNLAAESHVDNSINSPLTFIENNIIGTYNLLDTSLKYWEKLDMSRKIVFKFIHISTDEVFGSLGFSGSFNEESKYDPRSPYSASKASSDHLVNAWHHTYGLPTITTNCSNNFGPWQFPEKLIPVVITKALKGEKIPLYGDGKNVRDWLFVDDHIEALKLIAYKGKLGENYCIGGSNEKSNFDLIKVICMNLDEMRPKSFPYIKLISFVEDRLGHDRRYSINANKIKNELGWEEQNSFENNLKKTILWYLNNLTWCEKMLDRNF